MLTRRRVLAAAGVVPISAWSPVGRLSPWRPDGYIRRQLETITNEHVPGALAVTRTDAGGRWARAGVADLGTSRLPEPDDRFRIASITKTFVATVVLQLVREGRVRLDDPIADHLPGLLPYPGTIRVRHLLQHTSGLPDYHAYEGLDSAAAYLTHRDDDPSPYESIALATAHPPLFPPGGGWNYADTNYLVLGLLVQRLTDASVARQVTGRVIEPLGLRSTSFPEHTPLIRGTHLHGYMPADLPGEPFGDVAHPVDFTNEIVDQTGAAGAMISSGPDLLRFLTALLSGRLLPPALMKEMTATVPTGPNGAGLLGYGLGLAAFDTGGPTVMLGNAGTIHGYNSVVLATRDATRRFAAVSTLNPIPDQTATALTQAFAAIARHVASDVP